MSKTLVLDAVTCIDYGWITPQGKLEGRSMTPTLLVTGPVEEVEAVVCDFGTIKRKLKSLIDDPVTGFDHKCVVVKSHVDTIDVQGGKTRLHTPYLTAEVPSDAVRTIDSANIGKELAAYLTAATGFDIQVIPGTAPVLPHMPEDCGYPTDPIFFNYCHPLKNSSSWGCRNGLHGHLSYVRPYWSTLIRTNPSYAVDMEFNRWLSKYYVHSSNVALRSDHDVLIQYMATDRGDFDILLPKDQVVILPDETTVEHLGSYILEQLRTPLTELYPLYRDHLTGIVVSEGLHKGVWVPNT